MLNSMPFPVNSDQFFFTIHAYFSIHASCVNLLVGLVFRSPVYFLSLHKSTETAATAHICGENCVLVCTLYSVQQSVVCSVYMRPVDFTDSDPHKEDKTESKKRIHWLTTSSSDEKENGERQIHYLRSEMLMQRKQR